MVNTPPPVDKKLHNKKLSPQERQFHRHFVLAFPAQQEGDGKKKKTKKGEQQINTNTKKITETGEYNQEETIM